MVANFPTHSDKKGRRHPLTVSNVAYLRATLARHSLLPADRSHARSSRPMAPPTHPSPRGLPGTRPTQRPGSETNALPPSACTNDQVTPSRNATRPAAPLAGPSPSKGRNSVPAKRPAAPPALAVSNTNQDPTPAHTSPPTIREHLNALAARRPDLRTCVEGIVRILHLIHNLASVRDAGVQEQRRGFIAQVHDIIRELQVSARTIDALTAEEQQALQRMMARDTAILAPAQRPAVTGGAVQQAGQVVRAGISPVTAPPRIPPFRLTFTIVPMSSLPLRVQVETMLKTYSSVLDNTAAPFPAATTPRFLRFDLEGFKQGNWTVRKTGNVQDLAAAQRLKSSLVKRYLECAVTVANAWRKSEVGKTSSAKFVTDVEIRFVSENGKMLSRRRQVAEF